MFSEKQIKHGAGSPYYAFLAAASGQLAWQIWTADLSSCADCNRKCAILFYSISWGVSIT